MSVEAIEAIETIEADRTVPGSSAREEEEQPLSLVLFSGTDDRLEAAAVLAAGAAAMGRPVNVFLQYWALDAFRAGRISADHGLAPEATGEGSRRLAARRAERPQQHWSVILQQAKEIGEVRVTACALSMETFGLVGGDLDPIVEGVEGVASFMARATGPITFI
jgi:peroxiredoxin family protein